MKILCQLPVNLPRGDKRFIPHYELLEKHYARVKRKDTEITIRGGQGCDNPDWLYYSGLRIFNDVRLLKSFIQAEKEGYDGISIACFLDPALNEARQLLSIPVTGLAESAIHFSCMIGARFAIITSVDRYIPTMEGHIQRYGAASKAINHNPVRAIGVKEDDIVANLRWVEKFNKISSGCLEDGAEVIIVGCGLMSPALVQAGMTEINGAAIIDPLIISLKLTEAMVDLHKANLPVVSRKNAYASLALEAQNEALAYFKALD